MKTVTVLDRLATFFLAFGLLLCFFLTLRLTACFGTPPVLDVPDSRVVLVLSSLALVIAAQHPVRLSKGLWAGLSTAIAALAFGTGFCGSGALQGSLVFLAGAPLLTGLIVGAVQNDQTISGCCH